jgi:hypothetical protein
MAQENFNVSEPNDGLGDKLRVAFIKVQSNFTDLFTNKVDKEAGKGLSTNDYTTTEKNKLANIEDFAEVNVQADFLQNDNTADDFIKNKPTIPVVDDYLLNGGYTGTAQDLANSITLQQATSGANKNLVNGIFQAGNDAGSDQTGINVNQIGEGAGKNNLGDSQNAFGPAAGKDNLADNQNAFGDNAGAENTGNNQNAFGQGAGQSNTFNDVNLFGNSTSADENGQTVFRSAGGFMARLSTLLLTASRKYILPDKSGTIALLSDIGVSNSKNLGPTGLNQGGILTINTNAAKFNLSAGFGYIVNGHSDPDTPTYIKVTWVAKIANTIPNLATQKQTYVAVDINGDLYFTNVPLTATQRRNFIRIGVLIHLNNSAVTYIDNQPTINIEIGGQVQDILEALGFRSLSGNRIFPVSTNLKIKKELGRVFKPGANFENLTTQPHSFTLAAQEPITFRYRTQTGAEGLDITDITPAIYDLNGAITPVAATATLATIQRVYIFQDGVIRIQPGQRVFTTLNAAITALNSDVFITDLDIAENSLYLGAIVLTRNAVDLSNISQAIFAPSIGTTANGSVASPALAYTAEDVANKQNSLAVDGTGAKYPTVDAVKAGLNALLPNPALGNVLRGNGTAYDAIPEVEFMRVKSPFLKSHLATDINFDKLIYWDNFIRANSISLGTADSGQVYQNLNGAGWSIVGNEANSSEFSITAIPITSAGVTTSYISKNLLRNSPPNTARRAGVAFLKDKDNNISLTISRNTIFITKKTNGVDTILLSLNTGMDSVQGSEFTNTEIDIEFRIYSNPSKTFVFIFSNFLNINRIVDIQDTSYFNSINFFGFLAFENANPVVISSKLIKDI